MYDFWDLRSIYEGDGDGDGDDYDFVDDGDVDKEEFIRRTGLFIDQNYG